MGHNATSDERLRAAIESTKDSIVIADDQGHVAFLNRAAEALFGRPSAEVVGQPLDMLMPSRFREAHRRGFAHFFESGEGRVIGRTVELAGLRKDGAEFPLELSLAFAQGETGSFFTGIIRDISERKHLEQLRAAQLAVTRVLAESSASLSESGSRILAAICEHVRWDVGNLWLLDGVPPVLRCTSIWCADGLAEGPFVAMSKGVTFASGVGLPGRVWASGQPTTIDDVDHDTNFPRHAAAAEDGLHGACGFPIVAGEDVVGVLEFFTRAARTPDDGVLEVMGALGSQVGQFVRRKRAEDAHQAIRAKLILADRLSSVGMLAAGVAHEINNPLAYVLTNLELIVEALRSSSLPPTAPLRDIQEMANDAREGAERVRKIVRGMKAFSRADEERRVPLDVRAALDVSISMASNEIRHRAQLVKDYHEAPLVEADEARLVQVFLNLLVNAAQALPEGRVDQNEIRIVTGCDHSGRALVEIHDSGAGIAPEALGRIFDPFFTTKPIGVGTGLGLSICHGIVTDLGGELEVESEVAKGSVFRVLLPPTSLERPLQAERSVRRSIPARRGRVLVVDDDAMVAKATRRILEGHDVTLATGAKQALDLLLSDERFDVILCDLMMPDMTGMELHAVLMRISPEVADRMVFVTGGAFTASARAFLDDVPNERFEKPVDVRNLQALVSRLLR